LGFDRVYDYVVGKADWLAAGESSEGPKANTARVGSIADRDVITCSLETPLDDVAAELGNGDFAVVVDGRVVLGVVRRKDLHGRSGRSVADVMQEGPPTVRADLEVTELAARFAKPDLDALFVTTPQGELIGVLRRGAR
jgi:CBS domain-containing protein